MAECYMGYVLYLKEWHQNPSLAPPSLPRQQLVEDQTCQGGHEDQETLLITYEGEVNLDT